MESKPDWVGKNAFGSVTALMETASTFSVAAAKDNVYILNNATTKDVLRLERRVETNSSTNMSGHFFFVTVPTAEPPEMVLGKVKAKFDAAFHDVELWLERAREGVLLDALHFSRNLELGTFEHVINAAQEAGYRPFPNYAMG